jgi:integrase
MDPRTLLDDWLDTAPLRASTCMEYRREVGRWLDWCTRNHVDPYRAGIEDIAAWSEHDFLKEHLRRPFTDPAVLAELAAEKPEVAKSHDRRVTALTQFYEAAKDRGIIRLVPDLTMLRSGVDRDGTPPRRLTPEERAVLFYCIGTWGPEHARHYLRDRLVAFLLLEGLRPAEVRRVDMRHLYELPDFTYEVRAPDYEYEAIGPKHHLEPLTVAALKAYLPYRIKPAEGVHALIIGQGGQPISRGYPNMLVRQMCATQPLLAQRQPPVTADTIAHTGFWDTPQA